MSEPQSRRSHESQSSLPVCAPMTVVWPSWRTWRSCTAASATSPCARSRIVASSDLAAAELDGSASPDAVAAAAQPRRLPPEPARVSFCWRREFSGEPRVFDLAAESAEPNAKVRAISAWRRSWSVRGSAFWSRTSGGSHRGIAARSLSWETDASAEAALFRSLVDTGAGASALGEPTVEPAPLRPERKPAMSSASADGSAAAAAARPAWSWRTRPWSAGRRLTAWITERSSARTSRCITHESASSGGVGSGAAAAPPADARPPSVEIERVSCSSSAAKAMRRRPDAWGPAHVVSRV